MDRPKIETKVLPEEKKREKRLNYMTRRKVSQFPAGALYAKRARHFILD